MLPDRAEENVNLVGVKESGLPDRAEENVNLVGVKESGLPDRAKEKVNLVGVKESSLPDRAEEKANLVGVKESGLPDRVEETVDLVGQPSKNNRKSKSMWVSKITEDNLTEEIIDRLLFEGLTDKGEKADCIIVLGSIKAPKYRVPIAVEAYMAGRAEKIMLCGGALRSFSDATMSEAERMREKALELGVPEAGIIMENTSQNTVENMLCALVELQRTMWLNKVKSVLLVTTTYHMRRSLHIARYLFPAHIRVYFCPADDNNTRRDNWMHSEEGRKRAKTEAMNIVRCVNNGVMPDFEL